MPQLINNLEAVEQITRRWKALGKSLHDAATSSPSSRYHGAALYAVATAARRLEGAWNPANLAIDDPGRRLVGTGELARAAVTLGKAQESFDELMRRFGWLDIPQWRTIAQEVTERPAFVQSIARLRARAERGASPRETTVENAIEPAGNRPPLPLESLLDSEVLAVLVSDASTGEKMRRLCGIDRKYLAWKSTDWAALLQVSGQAIRRTDFWRRDLPAAREAGYLRPDPDPE